MGLWRFLGQISGNPEGVFGGKPNPEEVGLMMRNGLRFPCVPVTTYNGGSQRSTGFLNYSRMLVGESCNEDLWSKSR